MSITRVLSALVLVLVVGGTIWFLPPVATAVLAMVAGAMAAIELCALGRAAGSTAPPLLAATAAALSTMAIAGPVTTLPHAATNDAFTIIVIASTIAAGLATLALTPPGPPVFASLAVLLLAPLYIGVPLGTLAWIRAAHGPASLVWLIAVISFSDTAQYYTGTMFGRRKLSPVVSPGKTVEGAIGGFVGAFIGGALLASWALPGVGALHAGLIALGLALFGIAGDLFESLLKRSAGAKDSSTLIPGHGGVLDRIDAYLFAGPAFFIVLRYLS